MSHLQQQRISVLVVSARPVQFTVALALALLLALAAIPAQAQTFNVLHSFTGPDGANPLAGLTIDRAGNLYGTTWAGGTASCYFKFGCGTVFKMKHAGSGWVLTPLYSFSGGDGLGPEDRVIFGPDGTLYGETTYGQGYDCSCGNVFNLKPPPTRPATPFSPWNDSVLHQFYPGAGEGDEPGGDIVFDSAGNIYGTTESGGNDRFCGGLGCGTVYQLTPSNSGWIETVLYEFTDGADGEYPSGGVIVDQAGNLYGTAPQTAFGAGSIFELVPSGSGWKFSVLYGFSNGNDGGYPVAGLISDSSGNLYGATSYGGVNGGGTVFELTPSNGTWTLNTLYSFTKVNNAFRPGPVASLMMDAAGNLYGTTKADGAYGYGNVFKLTRSNGSWSYISLYDFSGGSDGANPYGSLVLDAQGNLYGTTYTGGQSGEDCLLNETYTCGVVFEITP
jgi:uncharacterized repeat protein (TIGR03803 family)